MAESSITSAREQAAVSNSSASVGNSVSSSSTSRASSGLLYPSLSAMSEEGEEDILEALGVPSAKPKGSKPPRPPLPSPGSCRSNTMPAISTPGTANQEVCVPPPLHPHEVRWFYQEPGKFWLPFGGYDSLCLERCYLDNKGWGLEGSGGEVSGDMEGEKQCSQEEVSVMGDLYAVNVQERVMEPIYWPVKDKWKVLRGCWFEVVGDKWYPFMEADYITIEEEHVKKKWRETAKKDAELQAWAASSAPSTHPVPKRSATAPSISNGPQPPAQDIIEEPVMVNKLSMEKYDMIWMSNGDIYRMKKELSSQLWNKVGKKFGKGMLFGATKVMRGYKEYASGEDRLPPIGHVVFVTHGIGQNMNASSIQQSTKDFREACSKIAKTQFSEHWTHKRVEFIPVEWRSGLSLDKGLVNSITPQGLKMLRDVVNDCVMDVFYYFSPKFGPELLNGLKIALQCQYDKFMWRNPHFVSQGGTVSVIAHSLGSVMLYDILREKCELDPQVSSTRQGPGAQTRDHAVRLSGSRGGVGYCVSMDTSMEDVDGAVPEEESGEMAMRRELEMLRRKVASLEQQLLLKSQPMPLNFSLDHFFAFGSPMGLFVAMNEHESMMTKDHMSAESFLPSCVCKRIHNLHHPSDPIAYRLEPLIHPHYSQVKPVKVCSANSKISQDLVDHAEGPSTDRPSPELQHKANRASWWASRASSLGQSLLSLATKKSPEAEQSQEKSQMFDSDKKLHPESRLKERLDFSMKESVMENSYLNSITAHYSYWSSADCAQYVLLQLYKYKGNSHRN